MGSKITMGYLRREGKFFLQGITVTFAFLAAIGTLGGIVFMVATVAVPGLREKMGSPNNLQGQLMLLAALQTIAWGFLRYLQFVPQRLARTMMIVMAAMTLFFMTLVLLSF
ncbi:MAG: hypothetical protein HC772_12185 [Leptolyngbyaceae cyanobacterium CRU_2_3]|nr:hypothetical protein [Leptolyngbyaceae cyanobacterium CRU_2_3]